MLEYDLLKVVLIVASRLDMFRDLGKIHRVADEKQSFLKSIMLSPVYCLIVLQS